MHSKNMRISCTIIEGVLELTRKNERDSWRSCSEMLSLCCMCHMLETFQSSVYGLRNRNEGLVTLKYLLEGKEQCEDLDY